MPVVAGEGDDRILAQLQIIQLLHDLPDVAVHGRDDLGIGSARLGELFVQGVIRLLGLLGII